MKKFTLFGNGFLMACIIYDLSLKNINVLTGLCIFGIISNTIFYFRTKENE